MASPPAPAPASPNPSAHAPRRTSRSAQARARACAWQTRSRVPPVPFSPIVEARSADAGARWRAGASDLAPVWLASSRRRLLSAAHEQLAEWRGEKAVRGVIGRGQSTGCGGGVGAVLTRASQRRTSCRAMRRDAMLCHACAWAAPGRCGMIGWLGVASMSVGCCTMRCILRSHSDPRRVAAAATYSALARGSKR